MEKGHGRDRHFSPGGAAYRSRSDPRTAGQLPAGGTAGDSGRLDRYELVETYEFCAAEYGWGPEYIEWHVTDEQLALYAEKAAKRNKAQAFAELDRLVAGMSWGVGIAFDKKGRNAAKWRSIRNRIGRESGQSRGGLTGAALEHAVMALAAADPSLVKIEQRGA